MTPPSVSTQAPPPAKVVDETSSVLQFMSQLMQAAPAWLAAMPPAGSGGGEDKKPSVSPPAAAPESASAEEPKVKESGSSRKSPVKIGKFDGTSSLDTFLMKFETCAAYQKWNDEDKLVQLMAAMDGNAAQLVHSCKGQLTYDNLLQKLRQRYGSSEQVDRYRQELRSRKQRANESLSELATELEKLATFGYPDEAPEAREKLFSLPAFMEAIADRDLSFEVFKIKPQSLREALNEAVRIETWWKSARKEKDRDGQKPRAVHGVVAETEPAANNNNGRRWDGNKRGNAARREAPAASAVESKPAAGPDPKLQQLQEEMQRVVLENQQLKQQVARQVQPPAAAWVQPPPPLQQQWPQPQFNAAAMPPAAMPVQPSAPTAKIDIVRHTKLIL
jgi:hypothetical protein